MATCVDCKRQFHPKQKETVRCPNCFFRLRAKADSRNQQIKKKLIKERGKQCERCGIEPKKIYLHHLTPVKDGGGLEASNLKLVCHDCHLAEHRGGWRNL